MIAPGPRRRRYARRWIGLLAVVVVLLAGWIAGFVGYAQLIPDTIEDETTPTDAIVVLTGGRGRLDAGVDLLTRKLGDRLFVSGVYRGVDVKTLLGVVQHMPVALENRIGIGDATNTYGNAAETAAWVREYGVRSIRLVTASYHMPRSLLEFHHAMPGVAVIPHPVFSENFKQSEWWAWPGTAALIAREYTKFLLAYVRQLIAGLDPQAGPSS